LQVDLSLHRERGWDFQCSTSPQIANRVKVLRTQKVRPLVKFVEIFLPLMDHCQVSERADDSARLVASFAMAKEVGLDQNDEIRGEKPVSDPSATVSGFDLRQQMKIRFLESGFFR